MSFSNIVTDAAISAVEGPINDFATSTVNVVGDFVKQNDPTGGFLGDMFDGILGGLMSGIPGMGAVTGPPYSNPLNVYSSYNYIFTLSPLSNNDINYPKSTYRINSPSGVILRSGGSGNLKITTEQEDMFGITTDLYIDNVEIMSIIAGNPDAKNSKALTINFTVVEPYSMGMFIESLVQGAKKKNFPNYTNAPFLLSLDFIGWDSNGNIVEVPDTSRKFPIKILDVKFKVDGSGSRYEVKSIIWEEQALADEVQSVKTDADIEGETINEILQTGPKSLASLLNTREQLLKKEGHKPDANEYVILFPKERSESLSSGDSNDSATTDTGSGEDKDFVREMYGTEDTPDVSGDPESEKEKILGFEMETGTIGDELRAIAEDESKTNDIGKSKIAKGYITQEIPYFGQPAFVEHENEPGMFQRDKIVANEDGTRLIFKKGQRVQEMIEEVILLSEYGREFINLEEDSNGMKPWFKIETEVYLGDSGDGMKKTGDKPKIFVYKVIPFKHNTSSYKAPSKGSSGIKSLKREVMKEYNYIYTGKNDSIIDFDIDINYAYIAALQNDFTNFADTKTTGSSTYVVEDEGDEDVEYTTQDGDEIPDEGSYTVTQSLRPSTGAAGGGSKNHTGSQASRSISDLITQGVDLLQLDLTIWGDPYFLSDSGVGNYTADPSNFINMTADGTMDYQESEVDIAVNFRTPTDIGSNGIMRFPSEIKTMAYHFSGLYFVLTVNHKFSEGKFTQVLNLVRRHNQDEDSSSSGKIEALKEKG